MQWYNADTNTVRNVRAFEYLKNEICRYWQVNNLNLLNANRNATVFRASKRAIKRKHVRISFNIEKKQSNYYVDAAIVSTKTREQVGTDENKELALTHFTQMKW